MDIIYRRAKKEDNNSINNLFIEMIKTVNQRMINDGIEPNLNLENGYEEGYLDTFHIDDNRVIFVALDQDKVIGFLSVVKNGNYLYLDDYCVTANYQGLGIGSNLIKMAE